MLHSTFHCLACAAHDEDCQEHLRNDIIALRVAVEALEKEIEIIKSPRP